MKKLLEYLPFHFTLSLIIGITSQFNFRIWSYGFSAIVYVAVVLFLLLLFLRKARCYFLVVWLFFFFVGVASVYIQNDRNYDSYYDHHIKKNTTICVVLDKALKSSTLYDKFEVSIVNVGTVPVRGTILLNIRKDSINRTLQIGNKLLLRTKIVELPPPLNPHQFDYRSYLNKQGIYGQVFIRFNEYIIAGEASFSLKKVASKIRNSVQLSLEKHIDHPEVLSITKALLLGQRQDISKDLRESYVKAGAIHILAVSGLHVGILYLILSYIFRPLDRFKNGRLCKVLIIVAALWMYALIAGLSASVVRAVTMFTFIALGMISNRRGNVLYPLTSSAFFLLLLKPLFLFDVGFQLSYLAVFGIVWIQPMLGNIWKPKYLILHKFWQLCTVSLAAQIMILPLSLYYFHQFPGLFILSNLVIVPFLGVILTGGIVLIILSLFGILPRFLVITYETVIEGMNSFVYWVADREQFLITDIPFSALLMIVCYCMILGLGNLYSNWHPKKIMVVLCCLAAFQGTLIFEKHVRNTKNNLVIFHKSRETIIGRRFHDSLDVYSNTPLSELDQSGTLKSYALGEGVSISLKGELLNYFALKNDEVLVIDKKEIYEFKGYKDAIVLLTGSPKVNVDRLIDRLHPKLIIADGSNYKSAVHDWKETCKKKKTPFWYTGQNGAYILEE